MNRISARRQLDADGIQFQEVVNALLALQADVQRQVAGRPVEKFWIYVTYEEVLSDTDAEGGGVRSPFDGPAA